MLKTQNADVLPIEQFAAELHSVCGNFEIAPSKGKMTGWGGISLNQYADIEIAMVATDLHQILRTTKNIKQDDGENYFLIMQHEGRALMSQNDSKTMLLPGDMVWIDSAKPSDFTFFGDRSAQISLHLPRTEVQERFGFEVSGGMSISRNDPTAIALQAVISKAVQVKPQSEQTGHLRDALFGLLGVFLAERQIIGSTNESLNYDRGGPLLANSLDMIDKSFRNPEFSTSELAGVFGVPIRQIQRAFENLGVTPTRFLLAKRLEFARLRLEAIKSGGRDELISSVAYGSGFSDLSYFNRRFREAYGCSPGEYKASQPN